MRLEIINIINNIFNFHSSLLPFKKRDVGHPMQQYQECHTYQRRFTYGKNRLKFETAHAQEF